MAGFNYTVTAAPGASYADAGVTAAKDYNVQNTGAGRVEYTTAAAQPATSFRGLTLERGEKDPVKIATGEKLWVRLAPGEKFAEAVLSGVEVP